MKLNFEQLESRCTPAFLGQIGSEFEYVGDGANHNVTVIDDGHGDLIGILDNAQPVTASGINAVTLLSLSGGNDNILYSLTAPRTQGESLTTEVGAATNLTVDSHLGSLAGMLNLTDIRVMASGTEKIMLGPVAAGATEVTIALSDASTGIVNENRVGNIAGSVVEFGHDAFGSTRLTMAYDGAVTGSYYAYLDGGYEYGYDTIDLTVEAGSTGSASAEIAGNYYGGDWITMNLVDNSGGAAKVHGVIHTTHANEAAGFVSVTPNVTKIYY
jgi:hypothetical protein